MQVNMLDTKNRLSSLIVAAERDEEVWSHAMAHPLLISIPAQFSLMWRMNENTGLNLFQHKLPLIYILKSFS